MNLSVNEQGSVIIKLNIDQHVIVECAREVISIHNEFNDCIMSALAACPEWKVKWYEVKGGFVKKVKKGSNTQRKDEAE